MNSFLVTGADGFISKYLCDSLAKAGHRIRGTTRKRSHPASCPSVSEWVTVDIGAKTDWSRALEGVDYVVHLAGLAHRPHLPENEFMHVNAEGTRCLAEQIARSSDVKRIIFVSSIGVMASSALKPLTESGPCEPGTPYAKSKLAAERAIMNAFGQNGPLDWCILRPPLVYGRDNPGNMKRLINWINRGFPLPLKSVNNKRSFLYIGNLVSAIERCIWHPLAAREIFLIADGETVSTSELICRLSRHAGKPARLFSVPPGWLRAVMDSQSIDRLLSDLVIDCTKLKTKINWQPPYTMEQGLISLFATETRL